MNKTPNYDLNIYDCSQDINIQTRDYIDNISENFSKLDTIIKNNSTITTISRSKYEALQDKSGIYFVVEDADL